MPNLNTMVKQLRKRLLRTAIPFALAFALGIPACSAGSGPEVIFGGRTETFDKSGPFRLTVGINGRGDLTLNKIDCGNVDDLSDLKGKLGIVFEDRRRLDIRDRDIFVEMDGVIPHSDVERLIDSLGGLGVSQITIISKY